MSSEFYTRFVWWTRFLFASNNKINTDSRILICNQKIMKSQRVSCCPNQQINDVTRNEYLKILWFIQQRNFFFVFILRSTTLSSLLCINIVAKIMASIRCQTHESCHWRLNVSEYLVLPLNILSMIDANKMRCHIFHCTKKSPHRMTSKIVR